MNSFQQLTPVNEGYNPWNADAKVVGFKESEAEGMCWSATQLPHSPRPSISWTDLAGDSGTFAIALYETRSQRVSDVLWR
ncbi:MAG: hypothetical protein MUF49_15725 [Oculatellaceae cyanobacterium Prado106]|jgi:hypothetical protein|nr:hypothetical protein [Oculatellaceae cyanobacterium Prado106]